MPPIGLSAPKSGAHPYVGRWNDLTSSQDGQGIVEYIVIVILVALITLFAIQRFGGALRNRFGHMIGTVSSIDVKDTANQQIQGGGTDHGVDDAIDKAQDGTQGAQVVPN